MGSELNPPFCLGLPEFWWRDHYNWLLERGYRLRPRYHPDWKPSWVGTRKRRREVEDAQLPIHAYVNDAVRVSNNEQVVLKSVDQTIHPYEVELTRLLGSEPVASDPANHSVRLLDILSPPDEPNSAVLVIPLLVPFFKPGFNTVGEVVDFMQQICEGIKFLHDRHIAHRDCTFTNIMMDPKPLFPNMFHFLDYERSRDWKRSSGYNYSRTKHPTKYIIIDFGLSRQYRAEDIPPLEEPIHSADQTVPENNKDDPCNPFPTDIYLIGNIFRQNFLPVVANLDFMKSLILDMTLEDPDERPTIDIVISRFEEIVRGLSKSKLRARLKTRGEYKIETWIAAIPHFVRTAGYILGGHDPIPKQK